MLKVLPVPSSQPRTPACEVVLQNSPGFRGRLDPSTGVPGLTGAPKTKPVKIMVRAAVSCMLDKESEDCSVDYRRK